MVSVSQWGSRTAEVALEQALIARFGTLDRVPTLSPTGVRSRG